LDARCELAELLACPGTVSAQVDDPVGPVKSLGSGRQSRLHTRMKCTDVVSVNTAVQKTIGERSHRGRAVAAGGRLTDHGFCLIGQTDLFFATLASSAKTK
jgi:hypothetical protein